METALHELRRRLLAYLAQWEIEAADAWPADARTRVRGRAVAIVSVQACRADGSGFCDYLGERLDEREGMWTEVYGWRAKVRFGLDLYAAADAGDAALQEAFDRIAHALSSGAPEGLYVEQLECGQTVYDEGARLLRRPAAVACRAFLAGTLSESGEFVDFEIKGGIL